MNKKIIAIAFFAFFAFYGYGQLSWNVKAGMNYSKLAGIETDFKPGYQFGVGMDYYFNDSWGIQPSLMLITKGFHGDYDYSGSEYWNGNPEYKNPYADWKSYFVKENRVYVQLPVMLAYRTNISNTAKLVFSGGGFIGYGVGGKWKGTITYKDGSKEDITELIFDNGGVVTIYDNSSFSQGKSRLDVGLAAGIGLELNNRFIVGLFGQYGLNKIGRERNLTVGINLGYKF